MSLVVLYYIALGSVCLSLVPLLLLPPCRCVYYEKVAAHNDVLVDFDRPLLELDSRSVATDSSVKLRLAQTPAHGDKKLVALLREKWLALKDFFASADAVVWAVLVVVLTAVNGLVMNYITSFFYAVDSAVDYNGFVVAGARFWGGLSALIPALPRLGVFLGTWSRSTSVTGAIIRYVLFPVSTH